MREVRSVAADRRRNRFSALRMRANLARQRQQPLGDLCRHVLDRNVLRDRGALVAALDIRPETPGLYRDSVAEILRALARFAASLAEFLRVTAIGIVGAGDECAELAAAKAKTPIAALRADARIGAVGTRRV